MNDEVLVQSGKELQHAVRTHDLPNLENLAGQELRVTGSKTLGIIDRAMWLELATKKFSWDAEFEFEDTVVHRHGDHAAVISFVSQKGSFEGKDASGTFFVIDVWVLREGRWQIISRHAPRIK